MKRLVSATVTLTGILLVFFLLGSGPAGAHCDTLDGPVVKAAKQALQQGDITPVLKWVKKEDEPEVRETFRKALAVRAKGTEAQELADRYFFETLVRIHRAGEGAAYTGLSAEPVEPIVAAADRALEKGSADNLVKHVSDAVAAGIRKRLANTTEKMKHADESVAAGRAFVEAYVDFTHYVERLYLQAGGPGEHGKSAEGPHKH
jgi:hypothetical protein